MTETVLEALAGDRRSIGSAWSPGTPVRPATFGLTGRGMMLSTIHEDAHARSGSCRSLSRLGCQDARRDAATMPR